MALKDDIALLARVPLFSDLNDEQLRLIAFGAEKRRVAAGQTLFRQGAPADCAYVVASGSFALTVHAHGRDTKLAHAGTASLLGEMAMISITERKFTAVATETSDVIRVTRPLFSRMLEEYPALAETMRGRVAANLRRLIAELEALAPRLKG